MQLSLSVRIAEGFLSKEEAILPFEDFAKIAQDSGYDGVCLRGSQLGVHSSSERVKIVAQMLTNHNLGVSMITGDFATVYNDDHGPDALRNITPYLNLAEAVNSPRIRVAMKKEDDIVPARRAADEAKERGLTLLHQCHIQSLFETVDGIVSTLEKIDRPNFRLIYEPANLEECGQDYGLASAQRLAPWIDNVYLQNQRIHADGAVTLETWCRGPVYFDLLQVHESGGVDFDVVFAALQAIGYEGNVTVHQSAPEGCSPAESARATADFLTSLMQRVE